MSDSYVSYLSTELLCQVFEHLNCQQQLTAMETCVRWAQILSSDRYLKHRRLCLSPHNLSPSVVQDLDEMKRFRAYGIEYSLDVPFLWNLRDFLFCEEVALNVEELRLRMSETLTSNDKLHLPALKEKWSVMRSRVTLPKLRTVVMDDPNWVINPIMLQHSEQIRDLTVRYIDKESFVMATGLRPFENLQSLTVVADHSRSFPRLTASDLTRSHALLFQRLKYLKITDGVDAFYFAYKSIFREATNLETLIIHGVDMSENAFNQIDGLKKLKELYLYCRIYQSRLVRHLALPNLQKLTTCQQMAPLSSTPNLKVLHIKDHKRLGGRFMFGEEEKLAGYFKQFNQRLEKLKLERIDLDSTFVKLICSLSRLQSLEMLGVEMEQTAIERVFNSLAELQMAHFERCNLVVSFSYAKEVESKDEDSKNLIGYFEQLRRDFANCYIVDVNCRVIPAGRGRFNMGTVWTDLWGFSVVDRIG
ncbi:conserved hypothetical protein [Culex quinquefasciatus]|uniref:F-box domain-containing protein n=1 Tax=Culex quinquefasciatus TaxID=7176 RepID=B0WD62_CULQU|nr:conserved hypothetical protein [Culex quinquefasciatus]|eukprot:XP_001846646.1 conserved hypothetical protein [Culex quinquefasciatus]